MSTIDKIRRTRRKPTTLVLDQVFSIRGDLNNYTLKFHGKEEDAEGKIVNRRTYWYYPSLKLCLEAYLDKSTIGCSSAEEIIEKIKEVKNIIKHL